MAHVSPSLVWSAYVLSKLSGESEALLEHLQPFFYNDGTGDAAPRVRALRNLRHKITPNVSLGHGICGTAIPKIGCSCPFDDGMFLSGMFCLVCGRRCGRPRRRWRGWATRRDDRHPCRSAPAHNR
jgi:hypothetical protein